MDDKDIRIDPERMRIKVRSSVTPDSHGYRMPAAADGEGQHERLYKHGSGKHDAGLEGAGVKVSPRAAHSPRRVVPLAQQVEAFWATIASPLM